MKSSEAARTSAFPSATWERGKWSLIFVGCLIATHLFGQNTNANLNPRQQAMQEAFNSPIDFWGKVVDQNGLPIAGAAVTFTVDDHFSFEDDKSKITVRTNSKGLFSLTGKKGIGLIVYVSKDGYHSTGDRSWADLNYLRKFSEKVTSFRRDGKTESFPTEVQPTIFVLAQ